MSDPIKRSANNDEATMTVAKDKVNNDKASEAQAPKKSRVVLGCIAFALVLLLVFCIVCMFLKMTEPVNVASLQGIYKEKDTLDVVVIGASEAYADYCAPLAYEEYGYTSYSYGVSGVPGSLYKSMMQEVLANQSPKLVVIEMNGLLQKDTYYERSGNLHGYLDNIDNKDNRAVAIEEAVPEDQKDDFKLINFLDVYHNSWTNPKKCFSTLFTRIGMALEPRSHLKGYATFAKTASTKNADKVKKNYFTDKSKAIFEDLLNYCDQSGVENILFVRFPHQNKDTEPEIEEAISQMAEAHGYKYVDLSEAKGEAGIVKIEDYYNDEHFNARGARKFTSYFGKYLVDNYDIVSEHSVEVKESWDKSVQETEEILTEAEKGIEDNLGTYYYELSVYLPKWFKPNNKDA